MSRVHYCEMCPYALVRRVDEAGCSWYSCQSENCEMRGRERSEAELFQRYPGEPYLDLVDELRNFERRTRTTVREIRPVRDVSLIGGVMREVVKLEIDLVLNTGEAAR